MELEGERVEIKMPNGGSFVVILEVATSTAIKFVYLEKWFALSLDLQKH